MAVCDGFTSGPDAVANFEFIQAVTCTYAVPAGFLMVGLLVFGAVAGSIYIRTGSVIIPFGLVLLTGGAILTTVAAPAIAFVVITFFLVGGGVVAYAYYRWS